MTTGPSPSPRIANKKARYNFEILETLEAGIALTGSEVKSLREGRASLEEAYAHIQQGELYLIDCDVSPYAQAGYSQHKPTRPRKLLIHRRELHKWEVKVVQRGVTIIPLAMYFNERGLVKVSLGLARGKTHGDKRSDIKKRDHEREMQQALRRRR